MKSFIFSTLFWWLLVPAGYGQADTLINLEGDTLLLPEVDFEAFRRNTYQQKMGMPVDDFTATDESDLTHRPGDYRGKILILYFWNIWDWDNCETLNATLNRIVEKYPFEVSVLSFVQEKIYLDERAFLQTHPLRFPVIPDSFQTGMQIHGYKTGVPLLFLVDRAGYYSSVEWDENRLEEKVKSLVGQ